MASFKKQEAASLRSTTFQNSNFNFSLNNKATGSGRALAALLRDAGSGRIARRALLLLFEAPRSSQPHAANRARNSGGRLVDLQIYFSFGLSRLLRLANDFLKRRKP